MPTLQAANVCDLDILWHLSHSSLRDGPAFVGAHIAKGNAAMSEVNEKQEAKHGDDHGHLITVTIDGHPKTIQQGRYLVSELKTKLGVSADLELDEVENGVFKPLDDSSHINVKEGDVFVSHVRRGAAS